MTAEKATSPKSGGVRRGPKSVNSDAQGILARTLMERGFKNPQLVLRWRDFVGPTLGRSTAPLSLSAQGQLTLSADPSVALFLQHQTNQLIQRINLALGETAVTKVKVVAGKFPQPKRPPLRPPLKPEDKAHISRATALVQDPDLRSALERLGQAVLQDARLAGRDIVKKA